MSASEAGPGAALHCATHPNVETYLRCAQCKTPICPQCLVMTPVGAKCRACARPRRLPTFELSPLNLVVATLLMIVGSVIAGAVGSIVLRFVPLFMMIFPLAVGFGLGEVISLAVNRKRGVILRVIAGIGVVISYLILSLGDFVVHEPFGLIGSGLVGPMLLNVLVGLVTNPFILVFLALGVWVAIYRIG